MITKLARVYEVSNGVEVDWVVAEDEEEAKNLSIEQGTQSSEEELTTTKMTYKQLGQVMIRDDHDKKRRSILNYLKESLDSRVLGSTAW
jgi:hypothetical protein